jgi:hypothetical protein
MDKQIKANKLIDGLLDRLMLKVKLNPLNKSLLAETKDSYTVTTKIPPFD